MSDGLDLQTELGRKLAMRARLDERVRLQSGEEPRAAEDPVALADLEQDLDRLRHQISALDVEIAELERELDALR